VSSTVRVWWEDTREERRDTPDLYDDDDEFDRKSDIEGKEWSGGTKTVEREPVLVLLLRLSMERIVLIDPVIEPVGDLVTEEESGIEIGRLTASLETQNSR
jgi:hypothetical protein